MSGNRSATARAEIAAKGASARTTLEGASKQDQPHRGLLKLKHAARLAGNKDRSVNEVNYLSPGLLAMGGALGALLLSRRVFFFVRALGVRATEVSGKPATC